MFKTPALGAPGLGSRSLGALALKRMARSDQQQGAWDLRDAQSIFVAEPELLGGIWLPDLTMMAQDSTGLTAAASGAVVGFARDVSQGLGTFARRNLLIYSDQFNNSAWAKYLNSITVNSEIAPNGLMAGDKLVVNNGEAAFSATISQQVYCLESTTYTCSIYLKNAGGNSIRISLRALQSGGTYISDARVNINLTTGGTSSPSAGSFSNFNYSVQIYTNEWMRITISATTPPNTGQCSLILFPNFIGDGTSGVCLWGAQIELGASATPYQPIVNSTGDTFIPGNHAFQPTTANKPTLLNWQSTGKYGFFPSADNIALTATFPSSLGSACTEFVTTPDGVEILEGRTVGTTYNIADRYFFGRILLNRACSPYEKGLFTRMLTRYIPNTSLYKYDFAITQTGGGAADLKIVTASATPVYIEWGDGTGGMVASNATLSHTYAATYAGNVRVSSLSPITQWYGVTGKWSFNLASLPGTLTHILCQGLNTLSGNVLSFPAGMIYVYISGYNTITGDISKLPTGLTQITCTGYSTLTGNLSYLPPLIVIFVGNGYISDYSGRTWAANMQRVICQPASPGGLSSAEVDQLLIDLAAAPGAWPAYKEITLKGANGARTSASDAAVATLQGKGVTVTTN